ncbi:MAG: CDP-2,3-bis-(O-geranylgeranyl)-sn-glycerol synthase [Candidatus Micrarchaeia archaeon]
MFAYPIIYILPAYVANGAPVIFGGGKPLDLGKKLFGKRIFGDHKTIKGLLAGLASGFIVSIVLSLFFPYMLAIGILLTVGTHIGDLLGSFIKRRIGAKPGVNIPIMDQYLFFVMALLFALPFGHLPSLYGLIFLVILTGILHRLTNIAAHKAKLKDVPW